MKILEATRKCIGFVAFQDQNNGQYVPVGTGFYLGYKKDEGVADPVYFVTAHHVIEGLRKKGVEDIYIVLNNKAAEANPRHLIRSKTDEWFSLDGIDIAILKIGIPTVCDHLVFPTDMCVTDEILQENEVGLGDEVFVTGLFVHHFGRTRNIPIVRIGNLAANDEERISTNSYGDIDAYLIEVRSIGGLSGSPVFLNFGYVRAVGSQLKFVKGKNPQSYLLGVIHGHYDVKPGMDNLAEDTNDIDKVNSGMAIVTPVHAVMNVIGAHMNKLDQASSP